jgi:hypothetical protein
MTNEKRKIKKKGIRFSGWLRINGYCFLLFRFLATLLSPPGRSDPRKEVGSGILEKINFKLIGNYTFREKFLLDYPDKSY